MQLEADVKKQIEELFKGLKSKVKLVNFTQELECQFCRETKDLVTEVAGLSDNIDCEVYNFQIDKEKAAEYGVDKIPATVVLGEKDYGIKYYGIPSGYEFSAFIEAIRMVGSGESGLSEATTTKLKELKNPVHVQVFATPT